MTIFTPEWISALHQSLNDNKAYQQYAATWEGSLLMVFMREGQIDPESSPAVFLDLFHGECRDAKVAGPEDFEQADFILAAGGKEWKQVLDREIAPLMAIMRGKLKLKKGSIVTLARYADAAKEIVNSAADLNAHIPDFWLE
ncbi:MAG: SCP2 sterol-binding domain-containing protein [Sphingobacteriales bacterium]|nr:MAG: SCP2 sterol-binding domain-containing protein [Sphingobacteriales bacterium]